MNSFLEASSEISSIFGGSFGDDMRSGGAAQAAGLLAVRCGASVVRKTKGRGGGDFCCNGANPQ